MGPPEWLVPHVEEAEQRFTVSPRPPKVQRWPIHGYAVRPLTWWKASASGDAWPVVDFVARTTGDDVEGWRRLIAILGPEALIEWLRWRDVTQTAMEAKLARALTTDEVTEDDVDRFADVLRSQGYRRELRNVAHVLREAPDYDKAPDRAERLAGFVEIHHVSTYQSRRRLEIESKRTKDETPIPTYRMDDVLARAVDEVIDRLFRGKSSTRCPGCGVWFVPRREGQQYHSDACRKANYDRRYYQTSRNRKAYMTAYRKLTAARKRRAPEAEIAALEAELDASRVRRKR